MQHELAATWGFANHASDIRNGLVWFAGIEQVFLWVALPVPASGSPDDL